MATAVDELTYVSFPITKFEKDADGDLVVYGKATDGSVDSDDQVVDSDWSGKALEDWHASGGNVRVQHQARRDPAGKSLAIDIDKDGDGGHYVRTLVVEPIAKRLVETGVLTAYSVGIARPVIKRDPSGKARGGIVAGGELAEISLVDRPANKNCGLVLAKAEGGAMELTGELFGEYEEAVKDADSGDLLTKAATGSDGEDPAGGDSTAATTSGNPVDDDPAADESDSEDDGAGDTTDDEDDAVSKASPEAQAAYKGARKEWMGRQPSVKGIAGGTEYLAKRADWMRWDAEGRAEGLDGTRDGAYLWLAKRDFSRQERETAADNGEAMPGGSFPIKNGSDLDNAIHLAGHAKDPAAARAHIKRRAAALGMSGKIPDSWKAEEAAETPGELMDVLGKDGITPEIATVMLGYEVTGKKAAPDGTVGDDKPDGKPCPTCKGDGKIMNGKRGCPDCKGSGKMTAKDTEDPEVAKGTGGKACKKCGKNFHADSAAKFCDTCGGKLKPSGGGSAKAAKKAAAVAVLKETLTVAVEQKMITPEAAQEILAQATADEEKASRPLPGDTHEAGTHREPDGTSTVERLEPQAGLPTDPDKTPDKVPASTEVGSMKSEAPYRVARMHDALCAAYSPADVLAMYPALKSAADAVDTSWFSGLLTDAVAADKTDAIPALTVLHQAAVAVKGMDPAAVEDGAAYSHKSFTDMYPTETIKPGDGIKPGQYQRPYLSGDTASETAGSKGSPHIPASAHTPEPEDFNRPLITDGHEAESPANGPANNRVAPGSPTAARTYYSNSSRDQARTALQNMHDHIAATFPDLCPMAASKSVLPPDLGAHNTPTAVHPPAQESSINVGKAAEVTPPAADPVPVALGGKQMRKAIEKALREMMPAAPAPGMSSEDLRTILTEQMTPFTHRYEQEMAAFRKELDELGGKPDPALAPVRGAIAKATNAPAVPVERRNLIDEMAEKARGHAAAEEATYRAYVEDRARSTDPGTREKALAVLDTLNKAAVTPPA